MRTLSTIKTSDYDLNRAIEDVKSVVNPISRNVYNNGILLENISLVEQQDNIIEHKLGTELRFWSLARGPVVTSYPTKPNSTNWTSYSLTIGASVTAPTKGSVSVDMAYYKVTDGSLRIKYNYRQTAAGAAGNGTYLFPIPSGYTIDTTKHPTSTASQTVAGIGRAYVESTTDGRGPGQVQAWDSTRLWIIANVGALSLNVNNTTFSLNQAVCMYSFDAEFPVLEATYVEPPTIFEVASDLPSKYIKLRTTKSCTVSLWVG